MSAGGILADTMANLKYSVANPEAVMKSPKVQAKIAAAKKAAADKQKVTPEFDYAKDKEMMQVEHQKQLKERAAERTYKIPFDADHKGPLGFANYYLHRGNMLIGSPMNLPKGERTKFARLVIQLLFAPSPVTSIDPLIVSCFTNFFQSDGGFLIKKIGGKVTGELIYDDNEFPMFSQDVERLKEKTEEAAKRFNLY
jgi:hypothetical protein